MTGLRSALWLPIFDDLADPVLLARLAAEAEEAGWHGMFVWDHLRRRAPVRRVADPWISLAAIATITGLRQDPKAPYDIAVAVAPGVDPKPYASAGATWWMTDFPPDAISLDQVRGVLRDGPV